MHIYDYVLHRKILKYDKMKCIQFGEGKLRYWSSRKTYLSPYTILSFMLSMEIFFHVTIQRRETFPKVVHNLTFL